MVLRDDAILAEKQWLEALTEIEKSYGQSPHLIDLQSGLGLIPKTGDLIEKPQSLAAWFAELAMLPIQRFLARRPAAEIHRLRSELPAAGRLAMSVERLFGTVAKW